MIKKAPPAGQPADAGPVDVVLLSHDQHPVCGASYRCTSTAGHTSPRAWTTGAPRFEQAGLADTLLVPE
jgi:hypothetical protein